MTQVSLPPAAGRAWRLPPAGSRLHGRCGRGKGPAGGAACPSPLAPFVVGRQDNGVGRAPFAAYRFHERRRERSHLKNPARRTPGRAVRLRRSLADYGFRLRSGHARGRSVIAVTDLGAGTRQSSPRGKPVGARGVMDIGPSGAIRETPPLACRGTVGRDRRALSRTYRGSP